MAGMVDCTVQYSTPLTLATIAGNTGCLNYGKITLDEVCKIPHSYALFIGVYCRRIVTIFTVTRTSGVFGGVPRQAGEIGARGTFHSP